MDKLIQSILGRTEVMICTGHSLNEMQKTKVEIDNLKTPVGKEMLVVKGTQTKTVK